MGYDSKVFAYLEQNNKFIKVHVNCGHSSGKSFCLEDKISKLS